jgi:hypothetical protein
VLENVRVHLVKDSKASERLGDLAQVLPKGGRSVMVLVGEKDVSCLLCLHLNLLPSLVGWSKCGYYIMVGSANTRINSM